MPVEIFFSYSHEDEQLMNEIRRQLVIFEREGKIIKWHDRQIPPGTEWEMQIDHRLKTAHIVLLFVSPAFLESRYCYDIEVVTALERHRQGKARVIPIILRPCAWDVAPFASLQALPKNAQPVTQWPDRDQVSLDIARSIIKVVDEVTSGGTRIVPPSGRKRKRIFYDGDRISRIVVPFTAPKGTNIPAGYQRRLNQIAADIAMDSAVRSTDGSFQYPVQLKGQVDAIRTFVERIKKSGRVTELGMDETESPAQIWFEYHGKFPPQEMKDLALTSSLNVVHCGANLLISMPTES